MLGGSLIEKARRCRSQQRRAGTGSTGGGRWEEPLPGIHVSSPHNHEEAVHP